MSFFSNGAAGASADRAKDLFREVTRLRRSGRIDEAYELGKTARAEFPTDDWILGAFGWCVIELVKRHSRSPDSDELKQYLEELACLQVKPSDEVLHAQRERWLSLVDEAGRDAERARQIGRQGDHEGAIAIFARLAEEGRLRDADRLSYGWELSRATQAPIKAGEGPSLSGAPVGKARRHIADYFKLNLSGPDLLHSRIAQQALTLAKAGHINIIPLVRMWDLETFRREDHERFHAEGGRTLPALSESMVNFAAKEAAAQGTDADVEFVLPHVERISEQFPDNQWLKMQRVKLLRRLGRDDEARSLAVEFVRSKSREFWAWGLLGDLMEDDAGRLACYAKALMCSSDDKFTGRVRLEFAEAIAGLHPGKARTEIDRVVSASRAAENNVPKKAEELMQRAWYLEAEPEPISTGLYERLSEPAERYLLAQLPKRLAVIDHVNHERRVFHFIVEKDVDGVAPFKTFGSAPNEGQVVRVQVDTVRGPDGSRTNLLSIENADEPVPSHLGRHFRGEVRVSNGMGFMPDGTFIPPPLIAAEHVSDGDVIEGLALINLDRKKRRWGFKALNLALVGDE